MITAVALLLATPKLPTLVLGKPILWLTPPAETSETWHSTALLSPNGKWVAHMSQGQLTVYSVKPPKPLYSVATETKTSTGPVLIFSPDSSQIAFSAGRQVTRLETKSGKSLGTYDSPTPIDAIAISHANAILAVVGGVPSRREMILVDLKSGDELSRPFTTEKGTPYQLAFTPDDRWVIDNHFDPFIAVEVEHHLIRKREPIKADGFFFAPLPGNEPPFQTWIINSGSVRPFDIDEPTPSPLASWALHETKGLPNIQPVMTDLAGNRFAFFVGDDVVVRGKAENEMVVLSGKDQPLAWSLSISDDGKYLLVYREDRSAEVYPILSR